MQTGTPGGGYVPGENWTPEVLKQMRTAHGFDKPEDLSRQIGVEADVIKEIEAGATITYDTAEAFGFVYGFEHPSLYILHNTAVTTYELVKGYMPLAQARQDLDLLTGILDANQNLPQDQFESCRITLAKFRSVVEELIAIRRQHFTDWPGAAEVDKAIGAREIILEPVGAQMGNPTTRGG